MEHTTATVYALFDVRDPEQRARYIGQTVSPLRRRRTKHVSVSNTRSRTTPVYGWIEGIGGAHVGVRALETCGYAERQAREAHWIAELGTDLERGGFNELLGNSPSERLRAEKSAKYRGVPKSAETRARMSATQKVLAKDRRFSAKSQLARAEAVKTPEFRAKHAAAVRLSAHLRWHVERGQVNKNCELCTSAALQQ